jgi:hypothetical protein
VQSGSNNARMRLNKSAFNVSTDDEHKSNYLKMKTYDSSICNHLLFKEFYKLHMLLLFT